MSSDATKKLFEGAATQWLCDGYSADIRFFATKENAKFYIRGAKISLNPLPAEMDMTLWLENSDFIIGQVQIKKSDKKNLIEIVEEALNGKISISSTELHLPCDGSLHYYSETNQRDRWFYDSHIQISGSRTRALSQIDLINIDTFLRSSSPPFDGLPDAAYWLGLDVAESDHQSPSIEVRINPPVDIIINQSFLSNNIFNLHLLAHDSFDLDAIQLAIRAVPGNGLRSRVQAAEKIKWQNTEKGFKQGDAIITLDNADNALAILMIEGSTIRRHWFLDAEKARNSRLIAVQNFDKDLKMVKNAVLETPDPNKFENGVAALLFLLGFTPSVQLETDSPDIIVSTPSGRLAVIECTTRVADFSTKLGKLVDRRGSLTKSLRSSGHHGDIASLLVCRQPRDQIATGNQETRLHNVVLITRDELITAFEQLRFHPDPDQLLRDAESKIASKTNDLFQSDP